VHLKNNFLINVGVSKFGGFHDQQPNGAIERNAYRSVEFKLIDFVQVIGLASFCALYRARSSLMLGLKRK